jgi:SlyX protein
MNEFDELAARLTALESHIAHQDGAIDDLNEMVNRQWAEIETLRRDLAELRARLTRVEGDLEPSQPDNKPPPHY